MWDITREILSANIISFIIIYICRKYKKKQFPYIYSYIYLLISFLQYVVYIHQRIWSPYFQENGSVYITKYNNSHKNHILRKQLLIWKGISSNWFSCRISNFSRHFNCMENENNIKLFAITSNIFTTFFIDIVIHILIIISH